MQRTFIEYKNFSTFFFAKLILEINNGKFPKQQNFGDVEEEKLKK